MSDRYRFVDCQGLAGAWTLGTVQTGRFELVHRCSEPGGFGDAVIDLNWQLLTPESDGVRRPRDYEFPRERPPFAWEEGDAWLWEAQEADYVCGTPPCSGFSPLNSSKGVNHRGPDSPINSCMRDLVSYAARCRGTDGVLGAPVVAFESVQGAFTKGRVLMQELRATMEQLTGRYYDLTHVKMSGASAGAAQYRHRYYFVVHRIPFGVDPPEPHRLKTVEDAIGDLAKMELSWDAQPYPEPGIVPGEYRSSDLTVDCHQAREHEHRMSKLISDPVVEQGWLPGEWLTERIQKLGRIPLIDQLGFGPRWNEDEGTLKGLQRHWPRRIRHDRPGWVVTGGSSLDHVHYEHPRFMSARELARLMGYPDDWKWPKPITVEACSSLIGKCCPVESGRWISGWAARALDGEPGRRGERIGEREYLCDSSLDYRRWPEEISGWRIDRPPHEGATLPKHWAVGSPA